MSQRWNRGYPLESRDKRPGKFWVYVLETDFGHYVGHTMNVPLRVKQHEADEVPSTAGRDPVLVWQSGSFGTREMAAKVEAAIKVMVDSPGPEFFRITGVKPRHWGIRIENRSRTRQGLNFRDQLLVGVAFLVVVGILLWRLISGSE